MQRRDMLPLSLPPRGLSREQAAAYFGISATLFTQLVEDGRAPKPRLINTRQVWDRLELDAAFSALPSRGESADNRWETAL